MRVIYIDILLFLNFYVTYFLTVGSACLLRCEIKFSRRILGSALGAFSSLIILLPDMSFFINAAFRLFSSLAIVSVAFGVGGAMRLLKNTFVFFSVSCVYAGAMLMLWLFAAPVGMVYNNGVSYFDLPMWMIMLSTAAAYFILRIVRYFSDAKALFDKKYEIEIITAKGSVALCALPDSGNRLVDFFSGLPVIFCNIEKCGSVCPDSVIRQLSCDKPNAEYIEGIRILPYATVSDSSEAICFKPERIIIFDGKEKRNVKALVGFTKNGLRNKDFDAVFNPKLFNS